MFNKNRTQEEHSSYSAKLALTAGSLSSLYLLPIAAQAGMVSCNGTASATCGASVTLSMSNAGGSVQYWDVDGDGRTVGGVANQDFKLLRGTGAGGRLFLNSATNGQGMLKNNRTYTNLPKMSVAVAASHKSQVRLFNFGNQAAASRVLGPTVAPGYSFRKANPGYNVYRTMWRVKAGQTVFGNFLQQFTTDNNYIRFAFMHTPTGGGTAYKVYGWAEINMDASTHSVTIAQWAYNDVPPAPDTGVPEPSTAALALIGLGAGGVRAWRSRKNKNAMSADALTA